MGKQQTPELTLSRANHKSTPGYLSRRIETRNLDLVTAVSHAHTCWCSKGLQPNQLIVNRNSEKLQGACIHTSYSRFEWYLFFSILGVVYITRSRSLYIDMWIIVVQVIQEWARGDWKCTRVRLYRMRNVTLPNKRPIVLLHWIIIENSTVLWMVNQELTSSAAIVTVWFVTKTGKILAFECKWVDFCKIWKRSLDC